MFDVHTHLSIYLTALCLVSISSQKFFIMYSVLPSSIIRSIPLSNTHRLGLPFNVRDQFPNSHKTAVRAIALCFLIFAYFGSKREDKIFWLEWKQPFPEFNVLLTSSCIQFNASVITVKISFAIKIYYY